jgi:DNA-binding IclR family transcriptional regulator
MRLVALAGQVVGRARIAERAVPLVAALHEDTGAIAHLAIPSYRSVLCVVHGNGSGPAAPGLHELAPAHCTATGKALLGHRDAWRESVLSVPLERRTARTITDARELRAEANAIRARGYATEDGENRGGVTGVAAPVFSAAGEAVAAIGVTTGPEGDLAALAERVLAAARDLEAADG